MRERRRAAEDGEASAEGSLSQGGDATGDSDIARRSWGASDIVKLFHSACAAFNGMLQMLLLPLDLRGLAAFRIFLGLVAIVETLSFIYWREPLLSDSGLCSRTRLLTNLYGDVNPGSLQVYFAVSGSLPLMLLLLVHLAAAIAAMLGFRTHTSIGLLWLLRMGIRGRLAYTGYSADGLIVASLFWAFYLPTGKRYSLDAFWAGDQLSSKSNHRASVDTYFLLLELTLMYAFAGYYKTGDAWLEGHAVETVLQGNIARSYLANLLLTQAWLCPLLCKAALWLELYGWWALLVPHWCARMLTCCVLLGFHISMWMLLDVDLFQPIACSLLIGCLPAPFWDVVDVVVASYSKLLCRECSTVLLAKAQTQSHGSSNEIDNSVQTQSHGSSNEIDNSVMMNSLFIRSLQRIGRLGLRLSALYLMFLNFHISCVEFQSQRLDDISPPFCSAVLQYNNWLENSWLATNWDAVKVMESVHTLTGLHQTFSMFSPNPPLEFWWVRMSGITQGGRMVAPWVDGRPNFNARRDVSSEKKRSKSGSGLPEFEQRPLIPFYTHRWLKLFEHEVFYTHCLKDFGQYMCQSWNTQNEGNLTMVFFRVIKLWSPVHRPSELDSAPEAKVLSYHACMDNHIGLTEKLSEPREYSLDEICEQDRESRRLEICRGVGML